MAEFVPEITWLRLRKMSYDQISKLPSCEVIGNSGNPYGTFLMNPSTDYIRAECDAKGMLSNTITGTEIPPEPKERILGVIEYNCSKCNKIHRKSSSLGRRHLKYRED